MVFIECPKQGIALFLSLVGLCNTPPSFKRYVMEPNVFLRDLTKCIVDVLNMLQP
jgi:hypothetical protein